MTTDFIRAINQVCAERGLTVEVVLDAIEQALVSAYKRDFGPAQHLEAKIDPSTGEMSIFTGKEIVETVEDPESEMELAEAKQVKPDSNLGDIVFVETTPPDFGRIGAQTAKQVILQRIREAERDALYETYAGREGEIVGGTVHSIDARGVTINLGRIEALMPRSHQVANERHYIRQKLRVLITEVNRTSRGCEIIVSRNHPDMLRRLLEVEVPEIYNGLVEIKAIAREAGSRAKVAVAAVQQGIDPVGACVGMRGVRIQSIVSELNGEKIDVIPWSRDPKEFISKSLSPARPVGVELTEDKETGKTATVIVPEKELSLAIGREGQNARLAAKLTGWRIDIISVTEAAERALRRAEQEAIRLAARAEIAEDMPLEKLDVSRRALNSLSGAGITELGPLLDKMGEGEEALLELKGFGPKSLQELKDALEDRDVWAILGREKVIPEEETPELEVEPEPEAAVPAPVEEAPLASAEAVEMVIEPPAVEEVVGEPTPEELEEPEPEEAAPEQVEGVEAAQPARAPDEIEEPHPQDSPPAKKKRRRRTLVYDESLGEVVAKKERKPGRRREEWERAPVEAWEEDSGAAEADLEAEESDSQDEEPDAS
ncbi:MAG: transcription termination/antitermination protein NusA [Anaerolineae bacterium]|nr:transcription termination/antitermination protein NusA [Anaerolineae bacterium]NIN99390.1 transcription termination/antitermination protein NusA [Anaerolineae bacterium]NIQ82255.1 transcription termination/antitermination protein NusA [Anaerolineae bacterium]